MVSIAELTQHYRQVFDAQQARVLVEAAVQIESDRVRREDFSALTAAVGRLAEAQERTEKRVDTLGLRLERLAEAQERTEKRVDTLGLRLERLAEAQERTEKRVDTLGLRLERLAEAQANTEQEIVKLVVGQQKLFDAMGQLAWTVRDTQKQVGGLAQTAGYALEAYALERLPKLLARRYGFVEMTSMPETFVRPDGSADEIDVVFRGTIGDHPVAFMCEVKTNITPREVQDFLGTVARVLPEAGCDDVRTLFFGYRAGPDSRELISATGAYLAFPHDVIIEPA